MAKGAVISPLPANVYLHYVFDLWVEAGRRKEASGQVVVVRYEDDLGGISVSGSSGAVLEGFSGSLAMVAKLKQIKQTLRRRMHQPLDQIGAWLQSVARGFYQYHAVPENLQNLQTMNTFRERLRRLWRATLRHRSQRRSDQWERIGPLFARWLPPPRTLHPYPGARFDATHPGQEPYAGIPPVRICAGGVG